MQYINFAGVMWQRRQPPG